MKKWIFALAPALLALSTWAVTPLGTAFTYQGQLMESGALANGSFNFRFNVYDDPNPAVGTLLGTIDKLAVAVAYGVFTVELDFGNIFQSGEALWLEVEVRSAGSADPFTSLSPTQALTAAPYAVFALSGNEGPPGEPADPTTIANLESVVCDLHSQVSTEPEPLPFLSCPRVVFVTNGALDGNYGGIGGADDRCQDAAVAAGLKGTFMAWLSTSTTNAKDRLVQGTGPYRRIDGVQVADNFADILDCGGGSCLDAPISVTETGATLSAQSVWTGTGADGLALSGNCGNWSSSSGSATVGGVSFSSGAWTNLGSIGCSESLHLYCFQQ